MTLTVAPGIVPPPTSCTVPLTVAVVWPVTAAGTKRRQTATIVGRSTSPIVAIGAPRHWHARQYAVALASGLELVLVCKFHVTPSAMTIRAFALAAAIAVLYALHQDVWFWRTARPLLFGFLPVGLAYHGAYCVAAALLMWTLTRVAWPHHLEAAAPVEEESRR